MTSVADPGFPRGGIANSPGGVPTYDFAIFSQKLHEIERIWTPGEARVSRVPLRSATGHGTCDFKIIFVFLPGRFPVQSDVLENVCSDKPLQPRPKSTPFVGAQGSSTHSRQSMRTSRDTDLLRQNHSHLNQLKKILGIFFFQKQ